MGATQCTGMELVTGATGYVGSRLVRRLAAEGRAVRALARRPEKLEPLDGVEAVDGRPRQRRRSRPRPRGRAPPPTTWSTRWRPQAPRRTASQTATAPRPRLREAATRAGVERIVYLGGIEPPGRASAHLGSRLEVERILFAAVPDSTALRASIVIGAGSSSFRILVRLVERLRVMPMPAWRENRTQPIAERDVIEFLARTPEVPGASGRSLDVVGPDVLTYAEMMARIADAMGVGRMPLGLGASLTPPASAVVAAVTGQPLELVGR